jgi:hypothetical protein
MPDDSVSTWLAAIHKAIKEHAEAVEKYQQSEVSQRQQQAEAEVKTVVRLPIEVSEYYRSEQRDRPISTRRDTVRLILEIVGVVLALAIAVLTLCSLFIFNGQLRQMQQANEASEVESRIARRHARQELRVAQQQAKAAQDSAKAIEGQTFQSERPWVAVSIAPASDFQYDEVRGGFLTLKFTLTNVGHSLAKYTSVWTDLPMNEKWPESMKRICAIPKAKVNAKSDYGYLLFPGQSVSVTMPAAARVEDIKHALVTTPFQGGGVVSVDVVVCVDYESVVDSSHHQTRIVRGVAYSDPTSGLVGAFAPNRTYDQIILIPRLHGDSAD